MSVTSANDEPEFTMYQQELDAAFHSRTDPFPAGTPEHAELLAFVCKLYKLRKSRPPESAAADGSGTGPADPQLAQRLGLPSSYDARFRVSASIVAPPERLSAAVRAIARRMAQRAAASASGLPAAASASGHNGGRTWPTARLGGHWNGHGSDRGSGGGGGVTPDVVEAASKVVEEYRCLLPWFEDFFQRRQMSRLRKLQSDRGALPAAALRDAIVSALDSSQTLVVAGDTGCGKSTQVPQFLAALASRYRRIAVTQPRRISAVSLARRVAVESCDTHGSSVAYKVRFSSSVAADSRIVFCTEGILLRELAGDPTLAAYDVVVLDEVHERHLTTDFLLALLRALLLQRPELRLVLMSATINCAAFADYFGGAPIVQIPGRLFPIQLVYVPPQTESEEARRRDVGHQRRRRAGGSGGGRQAASPTADQIDPAPYLRLLQRIDSEIPANQRGDLLIFVAGTADITALCTALAPYAEQTRRWILLPLHAALPLESQERVFDLAPDGVRKAIVATNIAETSLTIDGVRFVADSGRAKEMIHDVSSGGGSLQEGWISRASADQRKGRAGRTGPGICYRMYSEAQYNEMRAFSAPEIARVRLEAVVLGIKAMAGNAMDPRVFGFIDPPPPDRLEASITNLKQIGALSRRSEALTPLGAVLSLLPVDVAIGKLLVLGCVFGLAGPALTLAAALGVQSPFLKLGDEEQDQEAKAARGALVSPHGDALTLLNVFEAWLAVKQGTVSEAGGGDARARPGRGGGTGGQPASSARWCRRHGLAEARLYEMAKLRAQFAELLADAGILRPGGGSALSGGQAGMPRHRRHHNRHRLRSNRREEGPGGGGSSAGGLRGAELHTAKRRLRDMQAERERQRGRKVLRLEGGGGSRRRAGDRDDGGGDGVDASSAPSSSASSSSGEEELERLHDLDLRVHVDVGSMAAESARPLSPGDLGLLRHLLAASLYPRLAVADDANFQRREQDCRFHTLQVSDLVIHPGSSLFGFSNNLPRGQVLLYQELIETRRQYLSDVTPLWSLPALLLVARRVDCDAGASRWLVDGWLLLRLHDGSGPKVLQLIMELRGGAEHLIATRLRAAKLAALSAVQVAEDDDDGGDGGRGAVAAVGSQSFQRGYSALAAALPEALRPLLSGVMTQQAAWREEAEAWWQRQKERERRRLAVNWAVRGGHEYDDDGEDKEEEDCVYGRSAGAELEEMLAQRLALDMWPCRYSLERLPPGNKVTAQFLIDNRQLQPSPQPPGQRSDPGEEIADERPPPSPPPPQQQQQPEGNAAASGSAASGLAPAAAVGLETDPLGVPCSCAGIWLTPWLRYGSLRSFESAMAMHALQPALRKPWMCPGCGVRLVGTFLEVRDHVTGCNAVQGVDTWAVENLGYAQAGAGSGTVGRQRSGAAGGYGNDAKGDVDDGPLSAGVGTEAGGGAEQTRGEEEHGGGGGGGGRAESFTAVDAVDRLERYMANAVTWCRRRPAVVLAAPSQQGAEYSSRGGSGSGIGDGGAKVSSWRGDCGKPGGASLVRREEVAAGGGGEGGSGLPYPGTAALGAGVSGISSTGRADSSREAGASAEKDAAGVVEGVRSREAGGGSRCGIGGGASGPVEAGRVMEPAPITARPYKCPLCGLEAMMTPPQILRHKRQHA